jgi:two-component system sensor histidine kinase EvgS
MATTKLASDAAVRAEAKFQRRLLLLDDEEGIRIPVATYFRNLGWSVVAASEPEEAEALLEHESFDLVILDLWVTRFGKEGLEVLRSLRNSGLFTPVIILSAHVSAEVEEEARRCGADVVLKKPQPLADVAQVALALTEPRAEASA